jgi:hypothetical protein
MSTVPKLAAALACAWAVLSFPTQAAAPAWWAQSGREFLTPGAAAADNAPILQGQARQALWRAVQELDDKYLEVGGAGSILRDLVNNVPNAVVTSAVFNSGAANTPVVIGQLKFLTRHVFDRLDALGVSYAALKQSPSDLYPWTTSTADDADTAVAVLGQLKRLFSFNSRPDTDGDGILDPLEQSARSADRDGDGMPDQWESYFGLNFRAAAPANQDTDGDGIQDRVDTRPRSPGGALSIVILTPQGTIN